MAMAILLIILIIVLAVIFWQISTFASIYGGISYVGSKPAILRAAFKLAKLKNGEKLCELGSGLGNGLIIVSREFGASAVGIEISPFHWLISKFRTANDKNIKIFLGNFNKTNLRAADVVYCYLSPKLMARLQPKFAKELKPGNRVISFAFFLPDRKPSAVKSVNGGKIYLYKF